ncbi:hypothetical protein CXB51_018862 [Gossypium anomalum]|uniref:Uncharacterized protein n=1 Tax=Gossypium anomalum TaxID=47600 RepID=A0A8J6CSD2_9ROSI|nr:hypothetical protein CXB51_018862 [Gossypium anomalum]
MALQDAVVRVRTFCRDLRVDNLIRTPILLRRPRVLKINVDTAWLAREHLATYGAMVRVSKGMVQAVFTIHPDEAFTHSAKALAIIGHISIDLDCSTIVIQLNSSTLDSSLYDLIIEEAHGFLIDRSMGLRIN